MAQHFKDLVVWQKAMDMVAETYKLTDTFPKREVYSLTDQIRRAQPFRSQATSQRGRRTTAIVNSVISCAIPQVRLPSLRPNYSSLSV